MSMAEFYIENGIDPFNHYMEREWNEYQQFGGSDEEEIEEDPIQKQLINLKRQQEKALNADNLAYQEVREAWDVGVFRNAKNGSKQGKMNAENRKKGMTETAARKAEEKVLEFAKSHNIEPSSDEKLLKEMRQNISALDGAWNLHRVSMKNSRGMSDEQISKIMEMKEKGAQYLNFQFDIGPGSGSRQFNSENWTLCFAVRRSCGVGEDGVAGLDMDYVNFCLFNHCDGEDLDYEVLIIENGEVNDNAQICGNVYLDRLAAAKQQKLEDISYQIVVNVFPETDLK